MFDLLLHRGCRGTVHANHCGSTNLSVYHFTSKFVQNDSKWSKRCKKQPTQPTTSRLTPSLSLWYYRFTFRTFNNRFRRGNPYQVTRFALNPLYFLSKKLFNTFSVLFIASSDCIWWISSSVLVCVGNLISKPIWISSSFWTSFANALIPSTSSFVQVWVGNLISNPAWISSSLTTGLDFLSAAYFLILATSSSVQVWVGKPILSLFAQG